MPNDKYTFSDTVNHIGNSFIEYIISKNDYYQVRIAWVKEIAEYEGEQKKGKHHKVPKDIALKAFLKAVEVVKTKARQAQKKRDDADMEELSEEISILLNE